MIDAAVPQPVPPPTALPPVYQDNVGGAPADGAYENGNARLQMPLITQGPPAPPVLSSPSHAPPAPPPIAALPLHYHLPHYARPRPELALQRNVTVRGGVMPTMPIIAPGYQPPPTTQAPSTVGYHTPPVAPPIASVAYGSDGLLAGAEVRSYGGPLPPSPLDAAPAVPPEPQLGASHFASPTTQPPQPLYTPPPQAPQAANAAVSSRQAVDPHGNQSAPLTAPPRHVVPPVHPTTSPVDRAMFPRVPAVVAEPLPVEPPAP